MLTTWVKTHYIRESGFRNRGFFSCGIRNPGLWDPENSSKNPKSLSRLESGIHCVDPESKTALDSITWGERNHGGKNKWNVSASKRFCTSVPYRLENALTILPKEKAGTQRGFSSRKRLLHAILLTLTEIGYRNQRPLKTLKLQYRGQVTSTPIRRCVPKRHVEEK